MKKPKAPSQPSLRDERDLESVVDNEKEYALIRGRHVGFRDLNRWALHKISKVMISEGGDELTVSCKCVAAARLNGYFKIKFLWWALWRWYAYVRSYTDLELSAAVQLIKKKAEIALAVYSLNTTLMIAMRETVMKMNRQEAKATLQELSGDNPGKSAKSAHGSQSPSASSESL